MFTVVETSLFQKQRPLYWSEEDRGEFAAYIAEFPGAGDVVPSLAVFERSAGAGLVLVSPGAFASSTSRIPPRKKSFFY
ncbi:MAG: hypothetical protein Q8K18_10550 [Burkholderiales bacterium]|nr:hypothetical protein [Burkholderiales bacterium]